MSVMVAAALIALILALVEELRSRGESLAGWAVVVLCIGYLAASGFLPL